LTVTTLRPIANSSNPLLNNLECSIDDLIGSPNAYIAMNDQSDLTYLLTDAQYTPPILSGYGTFPCTTFSSSGGTITNVRAWIRYKTDISGALHGTCRVDLVIAGLHYNLTNAPLSTTITNAYMNFPTNPNTLAAWTDSDINAAQFGGFASAGAGPYAHNGYLYEAWVEVTWTPVVTTKLRRLLVGEGL
jgi:hypothetical protein